MSAIRPRDTASPRLATRLRGERLLYRTDGRTWAESLEPIVRDTAHLKSGAALGLEHLDQLVGVGLSDLASHPLPVTAIHPGPGDPIDPLAFASGLTVHRAERLFQLVELAGGALDNLEHGSLQLAALASRSLFEIAATTWDVQSALLETWSSAHGSGEAVRRLASSTDSAFWNALWSARVGTRDDDLVEQGWPSATNVLTRFRRFGGDDAAATETLKSVYASLCEAAHPNAEAQGSFWRVADIDRHGRQRIALDPTRSQSPVKLAIVDAVAISYKVILPFCRNLWWIAAETACACDFHRDRETSDLGLPRPGGRNDPCCCGSEVKAKACDHPGPRPLSDDIS